MLLHKVRYPGINSIVKEPRFQRPKRSDVWRVASDENRCQCSLRKRRSTRKQRTLSKLQAFLATFSLAGDCQDCQSGIVFFHSKLVLDKRKFWCILCALALWIVEC